MKNLLSILTFLTFNLLLSQKVSIKQFNEYDFEKITPIITYLSSVIPDKYKEIDIATKYDNLFRINILAKNYNRSLIQLDSVRSVYLKSNPTIAKVMGSQFEIYMKTVLKTKDLNTFDDNYKRAFIDKYESLPIKSRVLLPRYFNLDVQTTKKNIITLLKSDFENKDSIDIKKAILLCRNYNSYLVATKTFSLAENILKELDSENFIVKDSILVNNELSIRVIINKKITQPESVILVNNIYPTQDDVIDQKELSSYGYHSVYMYPRGKYISNSKIEPFEHEVTDIHKIIDWIIKQPWSNGKVGMTGGSYLGFSQWAATKKLHPALKTIIPQASVGIGTMDFPMNNNIFSSYTIRWLNFVTNNNTIDNSFNDEEKWMSIYKKWYQSGLPFNQLDSISGKRNEIFQKWIKHPSFDDYWKKMIPIQKEFSQINIPILSVTGYYDSDQLGALYYFNNHIEYNKKADHYLIIGPYDHSGAQGYISSNLKGYSIDDSANIDLYKISIEWFDYVLKGKEKPLFLKNKINYQVMGTDTWKNTASIDDFKKNKMKFYLQNDRTLSLDQKNKLYTSLKVDLGNRTDADELINQKDNIINNSIYNKNNLIFSSSNFEQAFEYTGNFDGILKFSVNKKDVDLYIKLYEQRKDGTYFLLSNYYGRGSYAKNPEKRKLLPINKFTEITISNNDFVSKKIEKGSKLILVLGIIKSPYMQINYGTGKDVSIESISDAKEPLEIKFYNSSFIEIPILKN